MYLTYNLPGRLLRPLLGPHENNPVIFLLEFQEQFPLVWIVCKRLFTVYMFPGFQGQEGTRGMPVVGGQVEYRIQARILQDFPEIMDCLWNIPDHVTQ